MPSSVSKPPPRRVVCTCSACVKLTFKNNFGQLTSGKWVPASTRTYHRKKDLTAVPTYDPPSFNPVPPLTHQPAATPFDENPSNPLAKERTILALAPAGQNAYVSLRESLFIAVCTLGAWLHLACGLSREATSRCLVAVSVIVQCAIELGRSTSHLPPNQAKRLNSLNLPGDVRSTISQLSIEPRIIRSICCPKCFMQYSLESLPQICLRRETPRSKTCNEKLWTIRNSRSGPRLVPCRLYSIQDFETWLEYFLSRPGIEDLIDQSYAHRPSPHKMQSIWDSPAWQSLGKDGTFCTTPGNLTFSYYIDWFNPFTNKIAGKSVSCGAIMMFCLNLPHNIQHLPENTFFAGITPPPHEPTMVTITAVADPIMEMFKPFWDGRIIKTYRHPHGVKKRAGILARIGDLLAMRKALGFAGVTSNNFCSFCKLQYEDVEDLAYYNWEPRKGPQVLLASHQWKEAHSKTLRDQIYRTHGVRWSSLHNLPYGDPVRHTLLGLMHNWLEGILQHQVRVYWGIGLIEPSKGSTEGDDDAQEQNEKDVITDEDLAHCNWELPFSADFEQELADEIAELHSESLTYIGTPHHLAQVHVEAAAESQTEPEIDSPNFDIMEDIDENMEYRPSPEPDFIEQDAGLPTFSPEDLTKIHLCLTHTIIPSWIERPPTNLGEKSHGKLKADQWLTLFTIFLPLVLPELWLSSLTPRNIELFNNFHDLVSCTNIVCSYTVTPQSAPAYLEHYIAYRKSSQALFPSIRSRPNHHFAMHNADMMQFWGPLMPLSEFAGERHNGSMQKIKTNNRLWELDFTMLRQICRRGRLLAYIRGSTILQSHRAETSFLPKIMAAFSQKPVEKEDPNGVGLVSVPPQIYQAILNHLNATSHSPPFRHYQALPHPIEANVLSRFAIPVSQLKHRSRNYSTFEKHPGNSSIRYHPFSEPRVNSGNIESAWRYTNIDGRTRTFLAVSTHRPLSNNDRQYSPYILRPGFCAKIAYARDPMNLSLVIIEPDNIVGHVAYYERPPGTFNISSATMVLIGSLDRDRGGQ